MKRARWPRSLRLRLTLWYAAAMMVVLVSYAGLVFAFLTQQLRLELNEALHGDFELAEQAIHPVPEGGLRWWRDDSDPDPAETDPRRWIEVWGLDGKLVFRHPPAERDGTMPVVAAPRSASERVFSTRLLDGRPVRVWQARTRVGDQELVFRAVRSEEELLRQLRGLAVGLAVSLPLAVLAAAGGGYLMAGRALAPVGAMAEQARRITAEALDQRLPINNPEDELGRMAGAFNDMLARLQRSFDQLRQFTADASHELRTPLTAIRSVGEVGLRKVQSPEGYREVIGSMLEETDRLARLVDSLLLLSRADHRDFAITLQPLELGALAGEVIDHLEVLAEERGQRIVQEGVPVEVRADRVMLRQALINIIDNAIKYAPENSPIRVVVRAWGDDAIVEVVDQGPGIPPEDQERVFDRFYRIDKARARATGGTGLGLSIARWAVESQDGTIELESKPGYGSTFRIVLPRRDGFA